MRSLVVHLPAGERRCAVEADALTAFARTLVDDLLFEAARNLPVDGGEIREVQTTITVAITLDADHAGLRITR